MCVCATVQVRNLDGLCELMLLSVLDQPEVQLSYTLCNSNVC